MKSNLKDAKKGIFSEKNAILSSECTHVPLSHLILLAGTSKASCSNLSIYTGSLDGLYSG